jgi:DNA adenine methylase
MNNKIKTALRYPGGKARALKHILPLIPTNFSEFREPFVGGGSVFISLKQEIESSDFRINDLNYDLFCFWKQLQKNADNFIAELIEIKKNTANGQELYNSLKRQPPIKKSQFETAVRFFILNRITFSGLSTSGGYSEQSFERRFTLSSIERLKPLSELIQDVKITNSGYEDLVRMKGENVFIFLDPPYFNAKASKLYGNKGHLHTSFDHERFANLMKKCNHDWLITCDDSPEIKDLFDFAEIIPWELQYGVNNKKNGDSSEVKAKKGKELFIFNYENPLKQSED